MNWLLLAAVFFSLTACILSGIGLFLVLRGQTGGARVQELLTRELRESRQEGVSAATQAIVALSGELNVRQEALSRSVMEMGRNVERRVYQFTVQCERQAAEMRTLMEQRLVALRQENTAELGKMRAVVDQQLQQTLERRLNQSFGAVGEQLEQVYRGIGEMQLLARDVGDLKKVLSNVKSRGVFGEVRLASILEDILPNGQYEANVATKRGSRAFVEFAVRLPGDGKTPVYLPIDAKFPLDAYTQLTEAQDVGDAAAVREKETQLSVRLRGFAKDIRDKYIDPPGTTEFAVLFLPFEGLYAQALRLGAAEVLQREFRVLVAGPMTMAALLNSLQMGFQTLAIQQRSSEVWEVLGAVRAEFGRFGDALGATRQRLEQAGDELDKLVGVRTRMIQRKLSQVAELEQAHARAVLEEDGEDV